MTPPGGFELDLVTSAFPALLDAEEPFGSSAVEGRTYLGLGFGPSLAKLSKIRQNTPICMNGPRCGHSGNPAKRRLGHWFRAKAKFSPSVTSTPPPSL